MNNQQALNNLTDQYERARSRKAVAESPFLAFRRAVEDTISVIEAGNYQVASVSGNMSRVMLQTILDLIKSGPADCEDGIRIQRELIQWTLEDFRDESAILNLTITRGDRSYWNACMMHLEAAWRKLERAYKLA
ncbi:hypothetical protein [Pontibacter sp. G13]|uniref:hypothetical protein n=1 Tax=Pontibacter sp. G13 TaxID=3074898 RepID=UPI00288AB25E|nr:hypothetical protein [Pontibacter sp. G13]WNJ20729.1 hypothetical protein RJD25_09625 [Pontibacter sp. G13]